MFEPIKAVAFDIDGTLYPEWKLSLLMAPYILKHARFFAAFRRTRSILHRQQWTGKENFQALQSETLAKELNVSVDDARDKIDTLVYTGFKPFFRHIAPFKEARETVIAFKEAGLKTALLSDFPPAQKGDVWGIAPLCDAVFGTEEWGALKPSPIPFLKLSAHLGVPPENILYVGNSLKYDVAGAQGAGLRTAVILPLGRRIFSKPYKEATISFKNYRQLRQIVLEYRKE
jgi:putative hydrolase of the HAD superfamily